MKQPIRGWFSQLGSAAADENLRRAIENLKEQTVVITISVYPDGADALYRTKNDAYITSVHLKEGQEASEERAVKNLIARLYRELGWEEETK